MTTDSAVKARRRHPANQGRCKDKHEQYRCHRREKHDGAHQAPVGSETLRWADAETAEPAA